MGNYLIYIIGFVIAMVLIIFIVKYKKEDKNNLENESNIQYSGENELIKSDNIPLETSEVDQLILRNSLGNELVFTRPNELSERKYQEVTLSKSGKLISHVAQAGTPALEKASTIAEIKKKAPDGIFLSTTDPANLSRFSKDGSYSTMVHNKKGIGEHKGFIKKDINDLIDGKNMLSAVNAGMQVSAAISGQYYLEEITSQLEKIDSKLEELIDFHHDERLAILKNGKNRLEEIIKKENVDQSDIVEIRSLRNSIREVFEEYRTRLDRQVRETIQFKSKSLFVEKRVDDYVNEIEKIKFNTHVSYEADKLSIQAELAEISVRMKLDYSDPVLKDLYLQLKNNIENSFSINIDKNILTLFRPIDMHADNIVKDGKDLFLIEKDRKKLLKSIYKISSELEKELNSDTIKNLLNESINQRGKPQEILIIPNTEGGEQKVYIPVEK